MHDRLIGGNPYPTPILRGAMKFTEARDKLKEIAKGRYHSLRYTLCEFKDGEQVSECGLYIDGLDWYYAHTWEDTFRKLKIGSKKKRVEKMPEF